MTEFHLWVTLLEPFYLFLFFFFFNKVYRHGEVVNATFLGRYT
jgi:hypothetical protein